MENYIKIETLGRGTYGNVHLVKNIHSQKVIKDIYNQLFALKKMPLLKKENASNVKIENEIAILDSLDHPNIVKYIESFEYKGKLCIVMEYCDCGDLKSLITKKKKLGKQIREEIIWDWFFQIVNALKYLHSKKIIHRDIKPENIFRNKSGQIKLGDFGISKILLNQDFAQTSLGTPYYLSPEICKGKAYNHKIDVWMIGCFIYEACNFQRPFQARNIVTLMNMIINDKHNRNNPLYSEDLQSLVDVLLEKDQDARPSINDLLELTFVKSHVKKYSPSNKFIKNKHFLYTNNLHIEIEDQTPNSSTISKFNSKNFNNDTNSEIDKKELEILKKNLISSPISNFSKGKSEGMNNTLNKNRRISVMVASSSKIVNSIQGFGSSANMPLYDKLYRSNVRPKSNICINNLNSNISSYEGEINLNNDNCSIYKNSKNQFKSSSQNRIKTTHSYYNLTKSGMNNNIQKIDIDLISCHSPDSRKIDNESVEKFDISIINMGFIKDNSSYEKKVKLRQKYKEEISLNENVMKKISSHECQEISPIPSYQNKYSLLQPLSDKIGNDKLNQMLEAIDKSESPFEFINNVDLVTSFCGTENKDFTIDILKSLITSIKTPSNGSTSTQYSFH